MKMNFKKILIAGTVLTAFCANAFAADEAQAPQPTMKEKVAAILHHDDDSSYKHDGKVSKHKRRGPKLTAEQKAEHKKLRKNWKNMSPEERQRAMEKMQKERQEAHDKYAKETMSKLTDEQKAEVEKFIKEDREQRMERKARLEKMTPEQREAIKANKPLPPKPPKAPKGFDKHHKGEFRGNAPHGGPHHPGEFPPPQDMMD